MKNHFKKINRKHFSLGDLVAIIGSCSKNDQETVAAVADMIEAGRVRVRTGGHLRRARLGR